jgi:molecular chaperone GrpE (heat shock protein)
MNAENKFNELVESFKKEIANAANNALSDIHSEMLPYVNDDTENNALYRARDIISQILTSNFTLEGDSIICDGWNTRLTTNDHDLLINKLAEKCSDKAAQQKISRLERQLAESENRGY